MGNAYQMCAICIVLINISKIILHLGRAYRYAKQSGGPKNKRLNWEQ